MRGKPTKKCATRLAKHSGTQGWDSLVLRDEAVKRFIYREPHKVAPVAFQKKVVFRERVETCVLEEGEYPLVVCESNPLSNQSRSNNQEACKPHSLAIRVAQKIMWPHPNHTVSR